MPTNHAAELSKAVEAAMFGVVKSCHLSRLDVLDEVLKRLASISSKGPGLDRAIEVVRAYQVEAGAEYLAAKGGR